MMPTLFRRSFSALLLLSVVACTSNSPVTSLFRSASPHEQYGQSLKTAKLDQTALGTDWFAASERALRDSLTIEIPYRERGYFSATKPFAVGYRLNAQRGDRVLLTVETAGLNEARVFIDVFMLEKRGKTSLVASSKADTNVLSWEPRRNQTYLIRVQPELLRNAQYTISITREPALAFPVQGRSSKQISSFWGANRDGGRRKHEGVDIFAPKGTPALASVNGVVSGVGVGKLGGNVAFLNDAERRVRLYYAHLDSWYVSNGQRVTVGDTIGFVGNTGNARTTGPHLHFGIYGFGEGAIDPLPFIRLGRGPANQSLLSASRLGDSVRVSATKSTLHLSPASKSPALSVLPKSTALTITGGTDAWLRVQLASGLTGYVASNTTESTKRPLRNVRLANARPLLDAADARAATKEALTAGTSVQVLATAGGFQLVREASGKTGWVQE